MCSARNATLEWMWTAQQRHSVNATNYDTAGIRLHTWSEAVFSYHAISCGHGEVARIPIEPLVGLLRHPLHHCYKRSSTVVSKAYLLPMHDKELVRAPPRRYFFDLGASLYNSGKNGASLSWFLGTYKGRGITFDRIFAWEATPYNGDAPILSKLPKSVHDALSYYNVPVDPTPGARENPLRTLRAVATPADFVVLKIDIDNVPIEWSLIQQILADADLAARIDELYFEHHVLLHPLAYKYDGWSADLDLKIHKKTLVDSYELFARLRERGIRAHSWV